MTVEERRLAIERIQARRGFYMHLVVYVIVNAGLVLLWALQDAGNFWPMWPMIGWGIGVIAHGFGVFVGPRPITEDQIQREVERGR